MAYLGVRGVDSQRSADNGVRNGVMFLGKKGEKERNIL